MGFHNAMKAEIIHVGNLLPRQTSYSPPPPLFKFLDKVLLCLSGWFWTHYVAQAGLKLTAVILPQLSSAGVTGRGQDVWLSPFVKLSSLRILRGCPVFFAQSLSSAVSHLLTPFLPTPSVFLQAIFSSAFLFRQGGCVFVFSEPCPECENCVFHMLAPQIQCIPVRIRDFCSC